MADTNMNLRKLPLPTLLALIMLTPFTKARQKLSCWSGLHDWTCANDQGIDVCDVPEAIAYMNQGDYLKGFYRYARMYCANCGKIYQGSLDKEHESASDS